MLFSPRMKRSRERIRGSLVCSENDFESGAHRKMMQTNVRQHAAGVAAYTGRNLRRVENKQLCTGGG